MPPSLVGTREWVSTRKPAARRRSTVASSSSRFWNTPPDSATVAGPPASRSGTQVPVTKSRPAPLWNRAAITAVRYAGQQVLGGRRGPGRRRHNNHAVVPYARRVGASLGRVGELLQLDRGLALVVDRVAEPEQRRHRVEQPPGAGGQRRVDPGAGDRARTSCQRSSLRRTTSSRPAVAVDAASR